MSDTHAIRLRTSWNQEASGQGVSWSRRFNMPTGLDGGQQVWIVIDGMPASGAARVNGQLLGPFSPQQACAFDITNLLALHNQVCLDLDSAGQPPSSTPDPQAVRLEIRTRSEPQ